MGAMLQRTMVAELLVLAMAACSDGGGPGPADGGACVHAYSLAYCVGQCSATTREACILAAADCTALRVCIMGPTP
jgi:hypothetical protein